MNRKEMIENVVEICRMLCISPEEAWNGHVAEEMKNSFSKDEIVGGAEKMLGGTAQAG